VADSFVGKKSGTAEDVSPLSLTWDRGVFLFPEKGFPRQGKLSPQAADEGASPELHSPLIRFAPFSTFPPPGEG